MSGREDLIERGKANLCEVGTSPMQTRTSQICDATVISLCQTVNCI